MRSRLRNNYSDSHVLHVLEKRLPRLAFDYMFDVLSQLKGLSWRHVDFTKRGPCLRILLEVIQVLEAVRSGEYERNLLYFSSF